MPRNPSLKFHSKTRRANPEARLQKCLLQHLKLRGVPGLLYFHPANEGRRSAIAGANLKAMGMLPGVADLVLCHEGRAYFLEVKAKGQKLSGAQTAFDVAASEADCPYEWADNIDAALMILNHWGLLRRAQSADDERRRAMA